jgi:N6-L-threonylcarbamoyladenine synthase
MAQSLAFAMSKPVIPVHHLEGHLLSPCMNAPELTFPFVALLVSGGHTQIMDVKSLGNYQIIGETLDDAAGEAFDKAAKLMGLDYPGGPILAQLAEYGDPHAFKLPRPMLHHSSLDMSFSGLKTAVLTTIKTLGSPISDTNKKNIAASFQEAVIDVLVHKCKKALQYTGYDQLIIAGGVGANKLLRQRIREHCTHVHYPPQWLCTDNGAMIAYVGALRLKDAREAGSFSIKPRWPLNLIS